MVAVKHVLFVFLCTSTCCWSASSTKQAMVSSFGLRTGQFYHAHVHMPVYGSTHINVCGCVG